MRLQEHYWPKTGRKLFFCKKHIIFEFGTKSYPLAGGHQKWSKTLNSCHFTSSKASKLWLELNIFTSLLFQSIYEASRSDKHSLHRTQILFGRKPGLPGKAPKYSSTSTGRVLSHAVPGTDLKCSKFPQLLDGALHSALPNHIAKIWGSEYPPTTFGPPCTYWSIFWDQCNPRSLGFQTVLLHPWDFEVFQSYGQFSQIFPSLAGNFFTFSPITITQKRLSWFG